MDRIAALERVTDATAPPPAAGGPVRGGSGLLKDQAACPFRAFAARRLAAAPIALAHAGLDAMARGILVHRVLETVWRRLGTKRALDATGAADLDALVADAAGRAVDEARARRPTTLSGRFAASATASRASRASGSRSSAVAASSPCSRSRTAAR
jgi:hypothetical protein